MMIRFKSSVLKILFFALIVRPFVYVLLGLRIRNRHLIPKHGPIILVANHRSHLDTAILMSLFPLRMLPEIHPVAAKDYFFKNRFLRWFSAQIIQVIPVDRGLPCTKGTVVPLHPLDAVSQVLLENKIIIFYPEGTRGQSEKMGRFKPGIAYLARRHPNIPILPIYLEGPGKALPKGSFLVKPSVCSATLGLSLKWCNNRLNFLSRLKDNLVGLGNAGEFSEWKDSAEAS